MTFVSPPPRTIPIILVRKHRELLWCMASLKSFFLISRRSGTAAEPTATSDSGRSGIVETPSSMGSDTVTAPSVPVSTFASLYCTRHRLRPDRFVASVFWKTILPRAHYWGIPIFLIWSREFSVDRDFIAQAGKVETMEQYLEVEEVFHRWPSCRSFLRGKLGLRVSSRRLRRLVAAVFADAG